MCFKILNNSYSESGLRKKNSYENDLTSSKNNWREIKASALLKYCEISKTTVIDPEAISQMFTDLVFIQRRFYFVLYFSKLFVVIIMNFTEYNLLVMENNIVK